MDVVNNKLKELDKASTMFVLRDLLHHLRSAGRYDRVEHLLTDLSFIRARLGGGLANLVATDYNIALGRTAHRSRCQISEDTLARSVNSGLGSSLHSSVDVLTKLRQRSDPRSIIMSPTLAQPAPPLSPDDFGTDRGASECLRSIREMEAGPSSAPNTDKSSRNIGEFALFVLSHLHFLSAHPEALVPTAWNYASDNVVSTRAEGLLDSLSGPWIARKERPSQALPICQRTIKAHALNASSIILGEDGNLLISAGSDETIRVWDVIGASNMVTITHPGWFPTIAASNDLSRVIARSRNKLGENSGDYARSVSVFDTSNGSLIRMLEGHTADVVSVGITSDGSIGMSASKDGQIRLWDLASGKCRCSLLNPDQKEIEMACLSQDGHVVVTFRMRGDIDVWDIESQTILLRISGTHTVKMAITPDARFLLTCEAIEAGQYFLRLWDVSSGRVLRDIDLQGRFANALAVSSDGRIAVAIGAMDDVFCRIWDLSTGDCVRDFQAHAAQQIVLSSDCGLLVSAGEDGNIKFWDIAKGRTDVFELWEALPGFLEIGNGFTIHQAKASYTKNETFLRHNCFLPDGPLTLFKNEENFLSLYNPLNGIEFRRVSMQSQRLDLDLLTDINPELLPNLSNKVPGVVLTHDGSLVAWIQADGIPCVWDLRDGTCRRMKQRPEKGDGANTTITALAFTSDGKFLVSLLIGDSIKVWDVAKRMPVRSMGAGSHCLAVSPDGRRLLSGDFDVLRLWDFNEADPIREFRGHQAAIYAVVYSLDGNYAVSVSDDETARLWDLRTGEGKAVYYAGERLRSLSNITGNGVFASSTLEGRLHRLEFKNLVMVEPLVTPTYVWRMDIPEQFIGPLPPAHEKYRKDRQSFEPGEQIPGHYSTEPEVRCPYCNRYTLLSDEGHEGATIDMATTASGAVRVASLFKRLLGHRPATVVTSTETKRQIVCGTCGRALSVNRAVLDRRRPFLSPKDSGKAVISDWVIEEVLMVNEGASTFEGADLSGLDLSLGQFGNLDLRNADLSYSRLVCADFGGADLRGANLCGADLRNDLDSLKEVKQLMGASNDREIEVWAQLKSVQLLAKLCSSKLKGARYDEGTMWPSAELKPERYGAKRM